MKNIFLAALFCSFFSQGAQAEDSGRPDLPNFNQVSPVLYRGGRPSTAGLQKLAQMGIRTIINLQGGDLDSDFWRILRFTEPGELPAAIKAEGEMAKTLQMNYLSYPLNSIDPVTDAEEANIAKILAHFQDPALQPIFIHCEHGKDRTGLLVALERIQAEGWTKQRAWNEWVSLGHGRIAQFFTRSLDRFFNSLD